jgi:hypothetical protein
VATRSINRFNFARERLLVGHRFLERMIVFVVLIIGPFKRNLEVHVHGAMMTNYDLQSPLMAFRFLAPATIRKDCAPMRTQKKTNRSTDRLKFYGQQGKRNQLNACGSQRGLHRLVFF